MSKRCWRWWKLLKPDQHHNFPIAWEINCFCHFPSLKRIITADLLLSELSVRSNDLKKIRGVCNIKWIYVKQKITHTLLLQRMFLYLNLYLYSHPGPWKHFCCISFLAEKQQRFLKSKKNESFLSTRQAELWIIEERGGSPQFVLILEWESFTFL